MRAILQAYGRGYRGIIGYILELYRDHGKENGNYNIRIGYILGVIGRFDYL